MDNLYERIIDLLGKSRYSSEFRGLLNDLGEKPERIIHEGPMNVDAFWTSGLFFHYRSDCVEEVSFHLSTAMVEARTIKQYSGNLPYGIIPTDDRAAVLSKLKLVPRSKRVRGRTDSDLEDYWEYFDLQGLEIVFIFDGRTKRVSMLSVHQSDFISNWIKGLL